MTGGLFVKSAVTMTYEGSVRSEGCPLTTLTYRYGLELANLLDFVSTRRDLEALELRLDLCLGNKALL